METVVRPLAIWNWLLLLLERNLAKKKEVEKYSAELEVLEQKSKKLEHTLDELTGKLKGVKERKATIGKTLGKFLSQDVEHLLKQQRKTLEQLVRAVEHLEKQRTALQQEREKLTAELASL